VVGRGGGGTIGDCIRLDVAPPPPILVILFSLFSVIRLKSSRPLITCLKLVGADISFLAICRIALDDVLFFVVFRILFSEPGELFNADMFSRRDPEDKGGNAAAAAPVLDDVDIEDEEIMGMSVVINDLPSFGPMCCKC